MFNFTKWLAFPSVLIFLTISIQAQQLEKLSLEEKVGQLFIVGIDGQQFGEKIQSHLKDLRPGGILLFKKNLSGDLQIRSLIHSMQLASSVPLFVAVDQEGGAVSRIKTDTRLPSASWVGHRNSPELTEQLGSAVGKILLSYGINMNLAPVLDVRSGDKSFLRSRSYSSDPTVVANLGESFSRGLLAAGVLPTAKHFPGMGAVESDPHESKAIANQADKKQFRMALIPFQRFVKISPSAIMLSHASYPILEPTLLPATYSTKITSRLLKDAMHFDGLVITDDILMGASLGSGSIESLTIKALVSGADILLFAWSQKSQRRAKAAIVNAIDSGKLSLDWLNKKVLRILTAKKSLGLIPSQSRNLANTDSDFVQKNKANQEELKSVIEKLRLARARAR